MRLLMYMLVLSCVTAATPRAAANLYWIAYEGDDFPENEGWTRNTRGGGAQRSLQDGALVLDSLASTEIIDFYRIDRQMNPDPGELFIAEWRLNVVENLNFREAGVTIAPDFPGTVSFQYTMDDIFSTFEDWSHPIRPLEFHTYRLESMDMLDYTLWIDGQFVRSGYWDLLAPNRSFFAFGDGGQFGGTGSLTEWDYVRFGVIPEPSTGLSLIVLFFASFVRPPASVRAGRAHISPARGQHRRKRHESKQKDSTAVRALRRGCLGSWAGVECNQDHSMERLHHKHQQVVC